MDKSDLRRSIMSAELSEDYIKISGEIIQNKVLRSEVFRKSRSVFIYVSTRNEPVTDIIIKTALLMGKNVCVPKCNSDATMSAVRISDLSELKYGRFGIREPLGSAEEKNFDLCIIPCVASSSDGRRLGHGGGYYDRFLENISTYKMCLCFGRNIIDDIPVSEHDIKMDEVITER